ncbi:uncharacterized protein LOC113858212 [Abrus precatorius]|uniref:Uncharacterized protein LOC113858212 n=1 Tax=Abrus precatorius TaxID=3816 RepID=A0A8B8KT84_ABRPR|nr:uncharacterized protein LOC113858212 [Abrus precatorius]
MTHANRSTGPFRLHNLKQLKIASCPMLRSLFTPFTAKTLTSLQYLTIEECHGLKFIVTEEAVQENNREEMIMKANEGNCDVLFPKLEVLRVEKCDLLEYLFPVYYARGLVELKIMFVCEAPQIKYIFGESQHRKNSSNKNKSQIQIQLPALTELCLRGLSRIISICPERFYVSCLSLRRFSLDSLGLPNMLTRNLISSKASQWGSTSNQVSLEEVEYGQTIEDSGKLSLCNCEIEAIFQIEGPSINRDQDPLTLSLSYLDLHNLPELKHIWKGPLQLLNLENLIELSVVECQKLQHIFSSSVLRSLPHLMSFTIKKCDQLMQIIEDKGDTNFLSHHCQRVCFPRLEILDIQQCNDLKCLLSISSSHEFPQLQYLFIENCSLLEKVFGEECEIEQEQTLSLPTLECLRLRKLSTSIPVVLNGYDPSPVVILDSEATNSSPIAPSIDLESSVSLPLVHHRIPTEVDPLDSSMGQWDITPTEYAAFRDIGPIKKRHVPLLEQAISSYPSLWSWREKFMRPKMREFGYTILGDMLEFLTLTRWGDLTETK